MTAVKQRVFSRFCDTSGLKNGLDVFESSTAHGSVKKEKPQPGGIVINQRLYFISKKSICRIEAECYKLINLKRVRFLHLLAVNYLKSSSFSYKTYKRIRFSFCGVFVEVSNGFQSVGF